MNGETCDGDDAVPCALGWTPQFAGDAARVGAFWVAIIEGLRPTRQSSDRPRCRAAQGDQQPSGEAAYVEVSPEALVSLADLVAGVVTFRM